MKSSLRLIIGVALISPLAAAAWAQGPPVLRASSIGAREQAVYGALLASWLGGAHVRQWVSVELAPQPSTSDPNVKQCAKGLHFPPVPAAHPTKKSLAGVEFPEGRVQLIDPSQWSVHDPGQGIASGKSADAAVEEGISHSLVTLSQIAFTEDGKDALVSFSMVCGSLCGSGSTMRLHETRGHWAIVDRCRNWIS
jgi:hypothetical protein